MKQRRNNSKLPTIFHRYRFGVTTSVPRNCSGPRRRKIRKIENIALRIQAARPHRRIIRRENKRSEMERKERVVRFLTSWSSERQILRPSATIRIEWFERNETKWRYSWPEERSLKNAERSRKYATHTHTHTHTYTHRGGSTRVRIESFASYLDVRAEWKRRRSVAREPPPWKLLPGACSSPLPIAVSRGTRQRYLEFKPSSTRRRDRDRRSRISTRRKFRHRDATNKRPSRGEGGSWWVKQTLVENVHDSVRAVLSVHRGIRRVKDKRRRTGG